MSTEMQVRTYAVLMNSEEPMTPIRIPEGAKVLGVCMKGYWPYIVAMVDPSRPEVETTVWVYASGQPIPNLDSLEYVGTCPTPPGILHVFREITA